MKASPKERAESMCASRPVPEIPMAFICAYSSLRNRKIRFIDMKFNVASAAQARRSLTPRGRETTEGEKKAGLVNSSARNEPARQRQKIIPVMS